MRPSYRRFVSAIATLYRTRWPARAFSNISSGPALRARHLNKFLIFLLFAGMGITSAAALEAISVPLNAATIDLTMVVERHADQGDRIQVSTAPAADGIVRRIEVRSENPASTSDWAVFALANTSDEQIDRLLVAPHYRLVGSGLFWPDLGTARLVAVTPSEGFAPDRLRSTDSDIFRITLNPGAIVTFIAELRSPNLPQLHLWEPEAFEETVNSYTLYRGIVLGIAALLALFLTVLFVVRGSAMFPATAALAWAVLAYISIDFGFWGRVFSLAPSAGPSWRAATEIMLAASLLVFLYTYLHLHRWHIRYSHVALIWFVGLIVLLGVVIIDPTVAAGAARLSLAGTAIVGLFIVFYLSLHNYDRAIMLIPTWLVLVFWVGAAWLAISGQIDNATMQPALAGGLVLIVMLAAFTIMQHAFAGGALAQGLISDAEQKALALVGAGHAIWDWDVARDRIEVGHDIEAILGLKNKVLEGPARDWLELLHPADRDRYRIVLDTVVDQGRGRVDQAFRMRAHDGHYHWFSLQARPIVGTDGEVMRCTGTISDITDVKTATERLLHDAIHDNLTGAPNRKLLLDRLDQLLVRAESAGGPAPVLIAADLDQFKDVNEAFGVSVGDSVLLAVSRRLSRLLRPQDTLARIHGDSFGIILQSESDGPAVESFAAEILKAIRAAITIGDSTIHLRASIGVAMPGSADNAEDQLRFAEAGAFEAKRTGGNCVVLYQAALGRHSDRLDLETALREALDKGLIDLAYQPIVRLSDNAVAGYEALLRWDHAKRGPISPAEIIPIAENCGLIAQLGNYVLERAARDLAAWQNETAGGELPFVSVNVSSRQLMRHDLINDVKTVLARSGVAPETLKLEITESLVMQNPEFSAQMLSRIKDLGAGLSLDDFGTGYSSLSYLLRFPFDTIKIDRSFVNPNGSSARPVILRSIVALAHDLGMAVIAEGAESENDALELEQIGCDFAQGYVFGRPATASAILQAIRSDAKTEKVDEPTILGMIRRLKS